ncbi:hypothetical protein MPSEU_001065600 [Mayamaea pseudoterrestris]|nr:hypothetical protein MPSEU_001065600 [Mayamaea pseudoterrestris]
MARPAEKARAMMNKWVKLREQGSKSFSSSTNRKRPHLASDCEHLVDAERFRNQIVREIADGVSKIQNPGLGEHAIRELNDEINHLIREKWHWNRRIKELGGLDYNTIERKRQVEEGDLQLGGYRYFGAAKDLPGVKELLAKEEAKRNLQKPMDLHKNLTPDYFGGGDEEDGVLLELEAIADRKRGVKRTGVQSDNDDDDDEDYLAVPSIEVIDEAMLERKKMLLLDRFGL